MTMNELLDIIPKEDYDKIIFYSDGIDWSNISKKVNIDEDTITIYPETKSYFEL